VRELATSHFGSSSCRQATQMRIALVDLNAASSSAIPSCIYGKSDRRMQSNAGLVLSSGPAKLIRSAEALEQTSSLNWKEGKLKGS
jgi:hypothetical protein